MGHGHHIGGGETGSRQRSALLLHFGPPRRHDGRMQEVAKSNDPVRLSFLTVLLRDAGIETVLLDQHASVMDGSIGAVPRRLMVADADYSRARRVLQEAGES
jgi:hypothetical protein